MNQKGAESHRLHGERRNATPFAPPGRLTTCGSVEQPTSRRPCQCRSGGAAGSPGPPRRSTSLPLSPTARYTIGPSRQTPHCALVSGTVSKIRCSGASPVTRNVSAERRADQLHESAVRDRVALEDRLRRLARLEGGCDVHQRQRRQAHRRRDDEVVAVLAPGDDRERERRHQQLATPSRIAERAVDDRRARVARRAPHQPGNGGVEAEPDREQHVDREVDPQDLQRRQRRAVRRCRRCRRRRT